MSKLIGFREANNSETNNAVQFIRRSNWSNGVKFYILKWAFMKPVYTDADKAKEKKLNDEAKPCPVFITTLDPIFVNSRFKSRIDKDDNILKHNGTFDQYLNAVLDRRIECQMSDTQVLDWVVEHVRGVELEVRVAPYITKDSYPANWVDFDFANPNYKPQLPTPQQQAAPQQPLAAQPQPAPQQPLYQATAAF